MKIEIEARCDGWRIRTEEDEFAWDHNDPELGVYQIRDCLASLGHNVIIEEVY